MTDDDRWHRLRATGDPTLRESLIGDHLYLTQIHTRRFRGRGVDPEDLEQVAALALVKAVDRFDPSFGTAFASFAGRTIDGELKRYLRDHGWGVRPPRRTQELVLAVRRTEEDLRHELGRAPTVGEIATRAGCTIDDVLEAREAAPARQPASLDAPRPSGSRPEDSRRAEGEPGSSFDLVETRMMVEELMEGLDETARRIVVARFFEGRAQHEIAAELGVSQSYLSRLLRGVLRELRSRSGAD